MEQARYITHWRGLFLAAINNYTIIIIIGIQPLGRFGQRPELSQSTGIALVRCIPGKFLGVVCHCFLPAIPFPQAWHIGVKFHVNIFYEKPIVVPSSCRICMISRTERLQCTLHSGPFVNMPGSRMNKWIQNQSWWSSRNIHASVLVVAVLAATLIINNLTIYARISSL